MAYGLDPRAFSIGEQSSTPTGVGSSLQQLRLGAGPYGAARSTMPMSAGYATGTPVSPLTQYSGGAPLGDGGAAAAGGILGKLTGVPWFDVINTVGGIFGAYMQHKSLKQLAADRQAQREQELQMHKDRMDLGRDEMNERIRQYNTSRRDDLNKLFKAKMDFLKFQRPHLRDKLQKMKASRYMGL